jgi:hypothetical protein
MMREERKKVKTYRPVNLTSVLWRNLPPIFKDISNSFYRMEKFGLKILINFIPKMREMDINHIGRRVKMVVKDLLRNHGPGDDLILMPHEKFKEGIFFRSEFDL